MAESNGSLLLALRLTIALAGKWDHYSGLRSTKEIEANSAWNATDHAPRPARDWPVPLSYYRPARRRARELGPQAIGQASVRRPWGLKIDHFATFSLFLHITGRNFPDVFIHSRLPMTMMNHEKFHGNGSALFREIRKTDTHRDRQTWQLYIYIYIEVCLRNQISAALALTVLRLHSD